MGKILECVQQFFEIDDWPYRLIEHKIDQGAPKSSVENSESSFFWPYNLVEGGDILQTWFNGDHGQFNCYAQEREEQQQLLFYSIFPVRISTGKMDLAAEFITRANYALLSGNFEMDYRSGRVRFKTSIDVYGETLTPGMVKKVVYANVYSMDRYLPGLMRVIYGELPAHEAIAEVENLPA